MIRFRHFLPLPFLALAASALADPSFAYNASDTRTVLQDLTGVSAGSIGWDTSLFTDASDADVYLNAVNIVPGAGFDPNIQFQPTPTTFNLYDYNAGHDSSYTLGTAISGGTGWYLRGLIGLDAFNSSAATLGTYDFSVELVGGADSAATDVLTTYDLHVEVFDRLDIAVSGTATDIAGPGDVGHLSMTIANNMTEDYVSTTWYSGVPGYAQDLNDPNSPTLSLNFTGNWFGQHVAPGDSRTDGHSDWSLNASSTVGTYHGSVGVIGGLHDGDNYFSAMQNVPDIRVAAVPEPASMAALAVGALGLLRRRRRA